MPTALVITTARPGISRATALVLPGAPIYTGLPDFHVFYEYDPVRPNSLQWLSANRKFLSEIVLVCFS